MRHRVAAHARHADVEDRDIGMKLRRGLERGGPSTAFATVWPSAVRRKASMSRPSSLSSATRIRSGFGGRVGSASLACAAGCACGIDRQGDDEFAARPAPSLRTSTMPPCSATRLRTSVRPTPRPARVRSSDTIALHEHVEDPRQQLRRDSDAGVANADAQLIRMVGVLADLLGNQPDVSAGRRELDRVVQQVDEHLRQADGIAVERDGLVRQRDRQGVPGRVDRRPAELDGAR